MRDIRVLYTEDTTSLYERTVPFMHQAMGVSVYHTINNAEAEKWFADGQRFDAYIFDDSAVSGGGHDIRLSMQIAQTLAKEGRGGIVISACSSNAELLRPRPGGISLKDLQDNGIEYWYKHTEVFTMFAWLATCLRDNIQESRNSWLESMGLSTWYDTMGSGNEFERQLSFLSTALDEYCPKGAFMKLDMPTFISRVNGGESVLNVLPEMAGQPGGIEKR